MEKTQFQLNDPRQRRIHQRLFLIGKGPASFYLDACRMMAEPTLLSSTHLVSHCLREVESSIRTVLAPLVLSKKAQKEESKASGKGGHEVSIRAVLQALDIDENAPEAQIWLALPVGEERLDKRAHRDALGEPRRLDETFQNFWESFNTVLDLVLDQLESRYLKVNKRIDELLGAKGVNAGHVSILLNEVPNNIVSFRHFFEKLQSPEWLGPLKRESMFKTAPAPERGEKEGTTRHSPWPQSNYLLRMARSDSDDVKKEVRDIVLELDDNGNIIAREDLLEIALSISPSLAEALCPKFIDWIREPYPYHSGGFGKLSVHLARGGCIDSAIALASALFATETTAPSAVPGKGDDDFDLPPSVNMRFDSWDYEEDLKTVVPEIVDTNREKGFTWICDQLQMALAAGVSNANREGKRDYSYAWRPAIEDHEQNLDMDARSHLVTAVRDAALLIARTQPGVIPEMVESLETREWSVFCRIALHVLEHAEGAQLDLVRARLLDQRRFDDLELRHEYFCLIKAKFNSLSEKEKETIFGYIDAGPANIERRREWHRERTGAEMTDEELRVTIAQWQVTKLAPIIDYLTGTWLGKYRALAEEFGLAEHPDFSGYVEAAYVGPNSPKTAADLQSMGATELAAFLKEWKPSRQRASLTEQPSREGLGRVLTGAIKTDPTSYAVHAQEFQGLDPTYIRGILSGFAQAAGEQKAFDWKPVLEVARWVVSQPVEIPSRGEHYMLDSDPSWSWTRKQVADLLSVGFNEGPSEIPLSLRALAWETLGPLTEDSEPTPEYEVQYGGSIMDPPTLALNTVRGQAMNAAARYTLWVHRNILNEPEGAERAKRGFDEMPEVRDVLDAHLDTDREESLAVRSVYGRWLPSLLVADGKWTTDNLDRIFPKDEAKAAYRATAFDTYVLFCSPSSSVFEILQDEYRSAIERLDQPHDAPRGSRPAEHLAQHLVVLFGWNVIQIGHGGVLDAFFSKAPDKIRAQALAFVGQILRKDGDVPNEWIERMKLLWKYRIDSSQGAPANQKAELASFGRTFSSGRLGDEWSLDRLTEVIRLVGTVSLDHTVVKRLPELVSDYPVKALTCLRLMIEEAQKPWAIYSWRDEIRRTISAALGTHDQPVRQMAIELIHRLAARNHPEFSDLLPSSSQ